MIGNRLVSTACDRTKGWHGAPAQKLWFFWYIVQLNSLRLWHVYLSPRTHHKKLVVLYGYRAPVFWLAFEPMKPTGWALGFVRSLPDKTDITDQELWVKNWVDHIALQIWMPREKKPPNITSSRKALTKTRTRKVLMPIKSRSGDRRTCELVDIASHRGNVR